MFKDRRCGAACTAQRRVAEYEAQKRRAKFKVVNRRHMMREKTYKITGTNILLTANGRMADPSDQYSLAYQIHVLGKPNTRAKKIKESPDVMKILEDWYHEEEKKLFFGLLYWDEALGFHMPADNILYMIREAYFGYGSTAKGGDRLLSVLTLDREAVPLEHSGPKTPQERWEQRLFRKSTVPNRAMGGAKVRVLQPFFKDWSLTFTVRWAKEAEEPSFLGKGRDFMVEDLTNRLIAQGHTFGLGAFRKSGNYGNFEVTSDEDSS